MEKKAVQVERETWGGSCEVLLSYIGFCVGLGNIWRFPYLCYRNGGGAFLVPYFLILVLAGVPIYFLEIALGQYSSSSVSTVWKFCPLFKGVGYCMVLTCFYSCISYNMLVAYGLRFLVASMTTVLPWSSCDNDWNTPACRSLDSIHSNSTRNGSVADTLSTNVSLGGYQIISNLDAETNHTLMDVDANTTLMVLSSPAEEYWKYRLLNMSEGISDLGPMQWELVLSLMVAWILVFLCLVKGIQSTGKVVYVTATLPYVVLSILLVRGLTLPGAVDGVLWYIVPDFNKLRNTKVWGDAASQIFYSLGQAWGILITYGSYNKFHHNSARDAVVACSVCAFTSLFGGFAVFSVIGFLAHELNVPIDKVITSGPGLTFVAYPEALARMPLAPMWAIIFFLMLVTLSIDSMFATFEVVLSALVDEFPQQLHSRKTLFTGVCSLFMFLLGLPLTCRGGIYILTLIDWYSAAFPPLIIAIFEVMLVSHVYGWRRFLGDIELMMGFRPNMYWKACWIVITPVVICFITIFNTVIFTPVSYGSYQYPAWAQGLGWLLCGSALLCIPIFMIGQLYLEAGSVLRLLREPLLFTRRLLVPRPSWGPLKATETDGLATEQEMQVLKDKKYAQEIIL